MEAEVRDRERDLREQESTTRQVREEREKIAREKEAREREMTSDMRKLMKQMQRLQKKQKMKEGWWRHVYLRETSQLSDVFVLRMINTTCTYSIVVLFQIQFLYFF